MIVSGSASKPLSREEWIDVHEKLLRVLKGGELPEDEIPDNPSYRCGECQDTAFVVSETLYGAKVAKRCQRCRAAVDAELRAAGRYQPLRDNVPEDRPPPAPRDWKKIAGLDETE